MRQDLSSDQTPCSDKVPGRGFFIRGCMFLAVAVVLGLASACSPARKPSIVALSHRVFRVSSSGRIRPFPYTFPRASESSVQGSTEPLPSPDGRWIAFGDPTGDYDAHLLDVTTLRQHRITWFGRAPRKGYTYAVVQIAGWSPDSRQLLLAVVPGYFMPSEQGDRHPQASYGTYIYNVENGTIRRLPVPAAGLDLVGWAPDGRIFANVFARPIWQDGRFMVLGPNGDDGKQVGVPLVQPRLSLDGRWLVGFVRGAGPGAARIVKVDSATMATTPLVTLDSWPLNSCATLSPDDRMVAYKLEKPHKGLYYSAKEDLFVGDRKIYACAGRIDYVWVDNREIALTCQSEALVVDSSSGKIVSLLKPSHNPR